MNHYPTDKYVVRTSDIRLTSKYQSDLIAKLPEEIVKAVLPVAGSVEGLLQGRSESFHLVLQSSETSASPFERARFEEQLAKWTREERVAFFRAVSQRRALLDMQL